MQEVLNVVDIASEEGTAQKEGEKISFFEFIFGHCFKKAKKKVEEFTLVGVIFTQGDMEYKILSKNEVILIGCPKRVRDVFIPDSVVYKDHTYNVTKIGYNVFYNSLLSSVRLPKCLRIIGKYAFDYCRFLTRVDFPEGLIEIEDGAFYDCKRLQIVNFSSTIESIGDCAFKCCDSLTSVVLPKNLKKINGAVFMQCLSLQSVVIYELVSEIQSRAFEYCDNLAYILYHGSQEPKIEDWTAFACPWRKGLGIYLPNAESGFHENLWGGYKVELHYGSYGETVFEGCKFYYDEKKVEECIIGEKDDRLQKVDAMIDGAKTPGEKAAAVEAKKRILKRRKKKCQ